MEKKGKKLDINRRIRARVRREQKKKKKLYVYYYYRFNVLRVFKSICQAAFTLVSGE